VTGERRMGRESGDARAGDSYSALERRFIGPFRRGLATVMEPIVAALAWARVSPNALSASQIVGGFVVLALVPEQPRLAFVLFVAVLLLDGLDGALARATGKASPFGGLVDQYCDHIREVTVIGGMALFGGLAILPAVLYGIVYTGLNLTIYLANAHGAPVPWAIKSWLVVYPGLFLYLWFGLDVLTPAVVLSEALMLVVILIGLRNLSRTMRAPA
jgi:phosphatidylglycerophosphate synthase